MIEVVRDFANELTHDRQLLLSISVISAFSLVSSLYIIVLMCIMYYIYYIQYRDAGYPKHFLTDISKQFKTGDIILFKASNNFNSIFMGLYFGHIGIVYKSAIDDVVYLFEANGIEYMNLLPDDTRTNGIFCTPLTERIQKYKGRVFYKQLRYPLSREIIEEFDTFVVFAKKNFTYNKNVFIESIKKNMGYQCDFDTNCAQIVYLSLIKLGLLSIHHYDTPIMRHLKYITDLSVVNFNSYNDIVEIVDTPFK